MQEKSSQNFTARLERLKFTLGHTDEALAECIGLSRRMLYLVRTGKAPASRKTWWKLEQAERAAGLTPPASDFQPLEKPSEKLPTPGNSPARISNPGKRVGGRKAELVAMRATLQAALAQVERLLKEEK